MGEQLYSANKNLKIKPNIRTYNNVISSYAKDGNGKKAEEILRYIIEKYNENMEEEELQPNTITYTSVIDAYARGTEKDAGIKAQTLLNEMYELYQTNKYKFIKPDVVTYNAVLNAVANSCDVNGGKKAEEL